MIRPPPRSTLFPNTPLSRSCSRDSNHPAATKKKGTKASIQCKPISLTAESAAKNPKGSARTTAKKDRKSTRLNSSHSQISYAVFCLKKKKKDRDQFLPEYIH